MSTRTLLVLLLAFLAGMIYLEWQRDYAPQAPDVTMAEDAFAPELDARPEAEPEADTPADVDVPELPDQPSDTARSVSEPDAQRTPAGERITVVTDTFELQIDPVGGTISEVKLIEYPVSLDSPDQPFVLLRDDAEVYLARSGMRSSAGTAPHHASRYRYQQNRYELNAGTDTLDVPLVWEEGGARVTKTLRFTRGSYEIEVIHTVENTGAETWQGGRYLQLVRTAPVNGNGPAFTNPERFSFVGAMVYSPEDKDQKLPLKDFPNKPYRSTYAGGWLAMLQHYFFSAWIPEAGQSHQYTTGVEDAGGRPGYVVSAISPVLSVAPGDSGQFRARLYAGPKLQRELEAVAPGLSLTVDYKIFTILSKPLFWLLDKIYSFLGNWGWAIIVLTLLIKLAFYKLTQAQFRSMAKMRKLTPRIQALKERYGDDRQKFGQKMMEIYKTEKVNPLGGCLPILVQIPIFIALYWVLLESVELRQSAFLWVPDLSRPDPYFILPIINGVAMIVTQRLMPTPGMDPMQRRLMQALPVVFAFLFALFPAGLVLYWAANTVISLAQQWWITRQIDRAP